MQERLAAVDSLRAVALFGVLTVNLLTDFRVPLFQYLARFHMHPGALNHAVDLASGLALEGKAIVVFSLLFGAGMEAQAGRDGPRLALRRLCALLAIGLAHMALLWNGDILAHYALAGLVTLPLLGRPRWQLGVGLAALALYALPSPWPDATPRGEELRRYTAEALAVYGRGSYRSIVAFRAWETPRYIAPLLAAITPRTVGLFLLGAYGWRRGVFREPSAHRALLGAVAAVGIPAGAAANVAMAVAAYRSIPLGGWYAPLNAASSVALGVGYAAAFLWLWSRPAWRALVTPLAPLGRMALTAYLAQSLVWGLVFYGYGLGLYGRMTSSRAALLGAALYAAQAAASAWWLRRFRHGPAEWLWRSLTYGRAQPTRVGA